MSASGLVRSAALVIAFVTTLPCAAQGAEDARLKARLDAATAAEVGAIVESARAAGLPTEPLVTQALQGASKGATGARIVSVVRTHAAALAGAREALGERSSESEIVAGAGALIAGVPRDTLARLRAVRSRQSLVVPLVVLADLVARQVPERTASAAVLEASRAGVRDDELMRLRERIERDIRGGAAPDGAASSRVRALILGLSTEPGRGAPPTRGSTEK